MKRFHVHVAVKDLSQSIAFYSKLFGQQPSAARGDYAKWMLDDPRVNFAISTRGQTPGLNHFGFQADSAEELDTLKERALAAAGDEVLEQGETTCCYANSNKHWTIDPQGLAWEHFQTMSNAVEFGGETTKAESSACCIPLSVEKTAPADSACCVPTGKNASGSCC